MAIHYDITAVDDATRSSEAWGNNLFFVTLVMSLVGVRSLLTDEDVERVFSRSVAFFGVTEPQGVNGDLKLEFWQGYKGVKVTNGYALTDAAFASDLVKRLREQLKLDAKRIAWKYGKR